MATIVPTPPPPLDPGVQRITSDGRPTVALVEYERKLLAWQRSIAALVATATGA